MTILTRKRLGPKKLALLLTVCSIRAISYGCDFTLYLTMTFLLEACKACLRTGNVNLDATKKAIALTEAVLIGITGSEWVSLTDRMKLSEKQKETIFQWKWIPDNRTWRSWAEFYKPEELLEVRIVPLEQFLEHSENTSAYSGYTKGYHESGRGYSRDGLVYGEGKTPFNPEIDEDRAAKPVDLYSPIDEDPDYQQLIQAIQRAKERRRKQK